MGSCGLITFASYQLDSATSLIQAAKNLMNAVVLTVKCSYVASTKYPRQGTIPVSILTLATWAHFSGHISLECFIGILDEKLLLLLLVFSSFLQYFSIFCRLFPQMILPLLIYVELPLYKMVCEVNDRDVIVFLFRGNFFRLNLINM